MDAGAGSGNASGGGGASACCYYALLGIRKNASATDIRTAYRRLAMVSSPSVVHARAAARRCFDWALSVLVPEQTT